MDHLFIQLFNLILQLTTKLQSLLQSLFDIYFHFCPYILEWTSSTCGGSVPRQNGKSLLVQGRAEAGMVMFNDQVIYTAHLQKTATETFEEMRDFFEWRNTRQGN